jgi:hypothetical protein
VDGDVHGGQLGLQQLPQAGVTESAAWIVATFCRCPAAVVVWVVVAAPIARSAAMTTVRTDFGMAVSPNGVAEVIESPRRGWSCGGFRFPVCLLR